MEVNIILFLIFGMGAGVAIGYLTALLRYNKSTPDGQKAQLQLKMALAQTVSLEKNLKELDQLLKDERTKTEKLNTENATLSANFLNLQKKFGYRKKRIRPTSKQIFIRI